MKSCPTCNRTFEDTFTFCLADGSLLSAPFDPQATQKIPEPRQTEPTTTINSPQPEKNSHELASTVASTAPAFESPQIERSPVQPARKSNRLSLMIGALATFLIIGVAVFILLGNRTDSARQNPLNENAATVNTAAPDSANATNSNSANSGTSSDTETTSSNQPAITTEGVDGEPVPSPSRSPTKKAPRVPSPSANSSGKDNAIVAKPVRPNINDSASPCANKAYPVCNPGERLVCHAATGVWQCRRSRK